MSRTLTTFLRNTTKNRNQFVVFYAHFSTYNYEKCDDRRNNNAPAIHLLIVSTVFNKWFLTNEAFPHS